VRFAQRQPLGAAGAVIVVVLVGVALFAPQPVASVAADLRIHEVVDAPNWIVACFMPDAVFAGD